MFWKFVCSSCTGCRQAVSSIQPGRRSWRHVHWTWCVDAVQRTSARSTLLNEALDAMEYSWFDYSSQVLGTHSDDNSSFWLGVIPHLFDKKPKPVRWLPQRPVSESFEPSRSVWRCPAVEWVPRVPGCAASPGAGSRTSATHSQHSCNKAETGLKQSWNRVEAVGRSVGRSINESINILSCAQKLTSGASQLSVELYLQRQTDGRRDASLRPSIRSFVRLSLCPLCLSRASILWMNKSRCFNLKIINLRNLREGE